MGSPCVRYIVGKEINKVVARYNEDKAREAVRDGGIPKALPKFHPHTIRHTFATRCAEKEIDVKVTQKILGHKNITMNLKKVPQ